MTEQTIKLKRISDKEIYDITGGWWLREGKTKNVIDELIPIPETHNHYLRKCVAIAQAQLEQDQKRVDELVKQVQTKPYYIEKGRKMERERIRLELTKIDAILDNDERQRTLINLIYVLKGRK